MIRRPTHTLFTIGHSNHSWERFVGLLRACQIEAVADVRSFPRSRFAQFNQAPLRARLVADRIDYLYFGDMLGGRPMGTGNPDYEAMAETASYRAALAKVIELAAAKRAAIMCSEHEPLACHRCLQLGRSLVGEGVTVRHILRDGTTESHGDSEQRLLALAGKKTSELFASPAERLAEAYRLQERALRRKTK